MNKVTTLAAYADDRGNRIDFTGSTEAAVQVEFTGSNNRLVVSEEARLGSLAVHFNCDNGVVEIGSSKGVPALSANLRVGQDSTIMVGKNVSSTSRVGMSAVEGTTITIGDDVMFASDNQVRCDDGHPIFDVRTAKRVNTSRSITIGNHVWVGWGAVLLGGTTVGEGSVVGIGSVVKGVFPNNCILAGVPARVLRRDVAWERPHLSLIKPYYKPDASTVERSAYWSLTVDGGAAPRRRLTVARVRAGARRRLRR